MKQTAIHATDKDEFDPKNEWPRSKWMIFKVCSTLMSIIQQWWYLRQLELERRSRRTLRLLHHQRRTSSTASCQYPTTHAHAEDLHQHALIMRLALKKNDRELSCALMDICTNFTTMDSTHTIFNSAARTLAARTVSLVDTYTSAAAAAYPIDAIV